MSTDKSTEIASFYGYHEQAKAELVKIFAAAMDTQDAKDEKLKDTRLLMARKEAATRKDIDRMSGVLKTLDTMIEAVAIPPSEFKSLRTMVYNPLQSKLVKARASLAFWTNEEAVMAWLIESQKR